MDYWERQTKPDPDLLWNLPEQKSGACTIIGGNSSNFATEIKLAEFLNTLNLKEVRLILPDVLKNKLPPLDNLVFAPSTDSGSFDKSPELTASINSTDSILIAGDLSKNSATAIAISEVIKNCERPVIVTRDAIDAVAAESTSLLEQSNLILVGSFTQLQKIFKTVYYPKMLLLSMPLVQAVETLHKFTLSYPCTILTFHQEQIIIARDGKITTVPINSTIYSPLTLWSGQLAAKITALCAWLPNQLYQNTITATCWQEKGQPIGYPSL
ncbi:hypothetical protein IKF76_01805 [Candidatus Saccharibacteria bacterium]|nr:hypothetical protein [Candidatus Saccharibacteria bacterium]